MYTNVVDTKNGHMYQKSNTEMSCPKTYIGYAMFKNMMYLMGKRKLFHHYLPLVFFTSVLVSCHEKYLFREDQE